MRFVIVTGMSGAGKTTALKILEDLGFFCVDNLPVPLVEKFTDLIFKEDDEVGIEKAAIGVDVRSGHTLCEIEGVLDRFTSADKKAEVLFLDAEDRVLIKRFSETRRIHPLDTGNSVDEGISLERQRLSFLKNRADYILDTGNMLTKELRQELQKIFVQNKQYRNMFINIVSFGFKYGMPADADLVFDVRFMPNPYYVAELKQKTGLDAEVRDYVMSSPVSGEFITKLTDMVKFLIPNYVQEGKNRLVIAIGCTGGKHRSVTVAKLLYDEIKKDDTYGIKLMHRNINSE